MNLFRKLVAVIIIIFVLAGCAAPLTPTAAPSALPDATTTPLPATSTPEPSATPLPPTPTALRTPPALPGVYQTSLLNPLDAPHTYITDTCEYLKARWDENNSRPGTVVMVIMYHSITKGATDGTRYDQISHNYQKKIMEHAAETGFQTITTEELANFLQKNAKIPPRSMLLLVDDRHSLEYFMDHFFPFMQKNGWRSVTNAYIGFDDGNPDLLPPLKQYASTGNIDMQAHGVVHNINITGDSSEDFMRSEIFGAVDFIEKQFGKKPIAYIWPGGSFTQKAVEIAHEAGYKLGFTVNPRGPVMFNWIPLSDQSDSARPSYIPEGMISDPLMVLPRYWSSDAAGKIDEVMNIGEQAGKEASANKETEILYYDIVCKEKYGPIPGINSTP